MDVNQLRRVKPELETFLDRYASYFGRSDTYLQARRLVYGLLNGTDRRDVENIAEAVKCGVVPTLQKIITEGSWKDDDVLSKLRTHVVEVLGDDNAVMCVDETGVRKGAKSIGVKRQYSDILGRVDNCQIGVIINYVSQGDHMLIDRRLYLPEESANDCDRRATAHVPVEVVFRTKLELALEMVADAVAHYMPFQFVTGDSVYGDSPTFVQGIRALRNLNVMDVSSEIHVWLQRSKRLRSGKPETRPISVAETLGQLPGKAWKKMTVTEGSLGPRVYEYAELLVCFSEEGLATPTFERLLFRRSLGQKAEIKYQRSNAPLQVKLPQLAQVGGQRRTIEQDF